MPTYEDEIRVLLLESDLDCARLVQLQLSRVDQGYAVETETSLADGLQKLSEQRFDAIVTDLTLADSEGIETVSRLRQGGNEAPVVVLTDLEDLTIEGEAIASGAQDYLIKGETSGRGLSRSIVHAVQRQRSLNEMGGLVTELEGGHKQLARQAKALRDNNREMRQQQKLAHDFVGTISHNFRTPIMVIKDYVSIIHDGLVGPVEEEQADLLRKLSIRTDDLNNLVDDLLDVSRLESGQVGAWRQNVAAAELIGPTESLLRQRAEVAGVDLEIECDPSLPEVYCDAGKVDRVISTLAVNAIKSAGRGGRVQIRVESDPIDHQVAISVSDSGPGLDAELLDTLGKRLKQSDGELRSTVQGFGVGLNIAQRFCDLNLGELRVSSRRGNGSTFSFTIPVADPIEVFERWFNRSRVTRKATQLLELTVVKGPVDQLDCFLSCHVRSGDLVLRVAEDRWMLLMDASVEEQERWSSQVQQDLARHNRNRPHGVLPGVILSRRASWDEVTQDKVVLEEFKSVVTTYSDFDAPESEAFQAVGLELEASR